MRDKLGLAIRIIAFIGVVLSGISVHSHYKKTATEYCDFGDTFNCDVVNRSVYSEIAHVPVAVIGIVGYTVLFGLSRADRRNRTAATLLFIFSLIGLGFALYLTYIEARVLLAYCVICLGSLACIAAITALAATRFAKGRAKVAV